LVTDHRDRLGALAEDQSELAAPKWRRLHAPSAGNKLDAQRNWLRDTVHGQVARDFAAARAGLFHLPAPEGDLWIFRHVEKLAAQMIVPLRDPGIDTGGIDRNIDGRLLGMIAIHHNRSAEFRKRAPGAPEHVPNLESDRRLCWIDLE